MTLSIIVAIARNGVIGHNNQLIWHLPQDLKRFKRITTGHAVVMGRKTFESIGRPLPQRQNIVLTRHPILLQGVQGIEVADSLSGALARAQGDEVFVIGGASIYADTLPQAHRLYVTHVHADYEGDTVFPPIDWSKWRKVHSEQVPACGDTPGYEFAHYERVTSV